ncbi:hypothetical protein Sste5346_008255 [Sporothrix stenoceras]|uniref:Uncharacterized protein n=1 Tax=Sporothrix stenoceras TaxID=5173 RepID=A0ABR3YRD9_9PEZI
MDSTNTTAGLPPSIEAGLLLIAEALQGKKRTRPRADDHNDVVSQSIEFCIMILLLFYLMKNCIDKKNEDKGKDKDKTKNDKDNKNSSSSSNNSKDITLRLHVYIKTECSCSRRYTNYDEQRRTEQRWGEQRWDQQPYDGRLWGEQPPSQAY